MRLLLIILVLFIGASCSKKAKEKSSYKTNPAETTKNFFTTASALTVEVAYEPGAEPYDDNLGVSSSSVWWILEENLNALYLGRSNAPVITVPQRMADFTALPAQSKTSWTAEDILQLADRYRVNKSTSGHSYFWVVFVNGRFNNSSGTIGVSIKGTTVIAIFKDVIKASDPGGPRTLVAKYVEQSTLVHEMGHALGLVNSGLPLKTSHEDTGHPAHCSDPDCVMYWSNEGSADMVNFVRKAITSGSVIMYDGQCLKDSREY